MSCSTSAPSLFQNVIFIAKKTFSNVGPKLSYLGIFGLELEKATVLWYFTSLPSNFSKYKISPKNKNPQICNQNCLKWVFWDGISKKLMPYLKSTFPNLLTCKVSSKNKKTLNLGLKFLFQHKLLISTLEFAKLKSFIQNERNRFGTKNALFQSLVWTVKNLLSYL